MPGKQNKYWMLTIPHEQFTPYLPESICYIKGQLEEGTNRRTGMELERVLDQADINFRGDVEERGYLHWQVMAIASAKCTLKKIREIFGPVHAEPSRSKAAEDYVWKEETRVEGTQFELGRKPTRRNVKADWDEIWKLAAQGKLLDIEAAIRFQHYRTIRTIRSDLATAVGMERVVNVFWGPTGTGKSRKAWDEAGMDAYPKDPRTKWWDGYNGEQHVVIDEFRGNIDISHLLRWFDRYPVRVEIKGATSIFRAEKIWITSNLSPHEWYPFMDKDTTDALMRRLNVTHFDQL